MTTDPPQPRRNWHFNRWLLVFILAVFGWGGWRAYAFRSALAEAKALGWSVNYSDPVETIRKDWKAAFQKKTWLDGVIGMGIPFSEEFEQHPAIVHRLNPKWLLIYDARTLRDLSALKPLDRLQTAEFNDCAGLTSVDGFKNLSALQRVYLTGCTGITNVDGLKNLAALHTVWLAGCTGLTSVDGLKNLPALHTVSLQGCPGLTNVEAFKNLAALRELWLTDCTGLTEESIAALKAALPNAKITGP